MLRKQERELARVNFGDFLALHRDKYSHCTPRARPLDWHFHSAAYSRLCSPLSTQRESWGHGADVRAPQVYSTIVHAPEGESAQNRMYGPGPKSKRTLHKLKKIRSTYLYLLCLFVPILSEWAVGRCFHSPLVESATFCCGFEYSKTVSEVVSAAGGASRLHLFRAVLMYLA